MKSDLYDETGCDKYDKPKLAAAGGCCCITVTTIIIIIWLISGSHHSIIDGSVIVPVFEKQPDLLKYNLDNSGVTFQKIHYTDN